MQVKENSQKFGGYIGDWLFAGYCVILLLIIGLTYTYVRSEAIARDAFYTATVVQAEANLR